MKPVEPDHTVNSELSHTSINIPQCSAEMTTTFITDHDGQQHSSSVMSARIQLMCKQNISFCQASYIFQVLNHHACCQVLQVLAGQLRLAWFAMVSHLQMARKLSGSDVIITKAVSFGL